MVGASLGSFFGGDGVSLEPVKGSFSIGRSQALLGPDLIPYLMEDFLLHSAMYSRQACFLSSGISEAGTCDFLYFQPLLQHSPFVWKQGHMKVPMNITLISGHFTLKVLSQVLPLVILNSATCLPFLIFLLFDSFVSPLRFPLPLQLLLLEVEGVCVFL